MSYRTLLFDIADHVATITLHRPDAANGMNLELAKELMQVALRHDVIRVLKPCYINV
ncbi:MAG TPA: hypothetical protein VNQ57_00895 [Ureibacillus sp.]|uniref:hypothetical protein n=1 Tax=Peribacillus asahii TaxID=228899 RepID=UPI00207A4EC7|nr:hypothetical protein [Peribacillus asahii]USK60176.1 hypothetical protein LIT37_02020 [Peribacillus asahii]HWL11515.1 hypothetical protein [Ureibacillus sp.]